MKHVKQSLRIGELAEELAVERFVIRFWEKEFDFEAHRSDGGQRYYRPKDVEKFKLIKQLLYENGFTIAGAKKVLMQQKAHAIRPLDRSNAEQPSSSSESLPELIVSKLVRLRAHLVKMRAQL